VAWARGYPLFLKAVFFFVPDSPERGSPNSLFGPILIPGVWDAAPPRKGPKTFAVILPKNSLPVEPPNGNRKE